MNFLIIFFFIFCSIMLFFLFVWIIVELIGNNHEGIAIVILAAGISLFVALLVVNSSSYNKRLPTESSEQK